MIKIISNEILVSFVILNMMISIILDFLILAVAAAGPSSFTLSLSNLTVNAVSDYTWTIWTNSTATRDPILLTFPSQVTLPIGITASSGGSPLGINSNIGNVLSLSTSSLTITTPLVIIIKNVINPPSALTSNVAFYFSSNIDVTTQLLIVNSVTYTSGPLPFCTWEFSLCTEQANSELTVRTTTTNPLLPGNNKLMVGYPSQWTNHNFKGLTYGATVLSCSISLNGGSFFPAGCSINSTSQKIALLFTLASGLSSTASVVAKIGGLQSPPTKETPSSTDFQLSTADGNGYLVDSFSGCSITPICVTNYTDGQLSNSPVTVNSKFVDQVISFNDYPVITFLSGDQVEVYFTPLSNLNNCTGFKFYRNSLNIQVLTPSTPQLTYLPYLFPSGPANSEYGYNITLYILCTSLLIPPSEAPTPLTFRFRRSGSLYLQLNATIAPTAAILNASLASLTLSTYQMGSINTAYVFSFVVGQPLSTTPSLKFVFPSDIALTGATCSVSLSCVVASSPSCIGVGTSLTVNFSASNYIPQGCTVQVTVNGLTNPLQPLQYYFGLTTFYEANVVASRVEYNDNAFNATYTVITNITVTLAPNSMSVYALTPTTISLTCPLDLPANSTFWVEFPTVPQIILPSQPLLVNNSAVSLISSPTLLPNSTFSFSTLQSTLRGSSLKITLTLRTPTVQGTYSFVTLRILHGGILYVASLYNMTLNVNASTNMPLTVVSNSPTAGAISSYTFTLTMIIPHPASFQLQLLVPLDTSFISSGFTCSGNCNNAFTVTGSMISLTAVNPSPNSLTPFNLVFTVSNFKNPRTTGASLPWNVSTLSSNSLISVQSASATISFCGIISGWLSQNETYYRSNTANVHLLLNLTIPLIAGDFILLSMDKTTYNTTAGVPFACSAFYGACSVEASTTPNVLVIKIQPNLTNYPSNPLHVVLEGLTSGANTNYLQTDYLTVGSYSSIGSLMEQGKVPYSIDCGGPLALNNNCRKCHANGSCIDCYISNGYFLNGSSCVTNCGNASSYLSFGNSSTGICQGCINYCQTCLNSTLCLTCVLPYYLYTDTFVCRLTCDTSAGYVSTTLSLRPACVPCADPFCLICSTATYGTCLLCNTNSVLAGGVCSSSCLNISYYVSGGICHLCDTACYSCTGSGNGSCLKCASGYVNASGFCSTSCISGQAIIPGTLTCGCDTPCLTCSPSNFANCTACMNSSLLLSMGQCLGSCPNGTYLDITTSICMACSSGCLICTASVCLNCPTGWILYGKMCVSDCNQLGQQYDRSGNSCILCPANCGSCSGSVCSSCLANYSLSSTSCIQTCLLLGNCPLSSSQILPLPGLIALVIWASIVGVIRFVSQKNYLPYSIILFSCLVQLTLAAIVIILAISTSNTSIGRLLLSLTWNDGHRGTMIGLLAFWISINYLTNAIHLFIFLRYMKPLLPNPKQTDNISINLVLILATLTNYRFALLPYAKLFPKPAIPISNSSQLTPLHYLCVASVISDIFLIAACGLGLYREQKGSNLFMLCLDLMIVVIVNIAITVWFASTNKSDEFYGQTKKYEVDEANNTNQNINPTTSEKDQSKINMIAIESVHFDDEVPQGQSHKVFKKKTEPFIANFTQSRDLSDVNVPTNQRPSNNTTNVIEIHPTNHFEDIDFEENLKPPKKRNIVNSSKITQFNHSQRSDRSPIQEDRNSAIREATYKLNKQFLSSQQKSKEDRSIVEVDFEDESDFPELQQESTYNGGRKSVFQPRQKLIRPKRVGTEKSVSNFKQEMSRSTHNQTQMKKEKKPRYVKDPVKEEVQDFQSILRKRIQESKIRRLGIEDNEIGEEISPSKFDFQNQRLKLQQIDL